MAWDEFTLDQLCEEIVDCVNKTAPSVNYITPFKMIRTTNIKNGKINIKDVRYVTEETYQKWTRRSVPQYGDVILTREAPIGEVGMVKTDEKIFLGQRLMQYRANRTRLDPKFLLYSLQAPYMQQQILSHEGSGSTVSHIRVPDAMKFKIRLPSLDIQKRIADILSSLDDKIELNLRMNETLEQMAMALYKHWFVDVEDSREQILLSELLTLNPTMSVKRGTLLKYVDMKALPTSQMSVPDDLIIEREFTSGTKFTKNDVLMARITPCLENGKSAFVDFLSEGEIAFGSTEFLVFRANEISCPQFLYCLVRDKGFHEFAKQTMVGTSGRQRVQSSILLQYELPKPNPDIMNKFRGKTTEWFNKVRANTVENHILKQTRDYLLPRLLLGEIELDEAEKQVEEVL